MFERIHKWLALRTYRAELGLLLLERYGRERYYTPPQVLTTIRVHALSRRYAAFACAMYCSKRAYDGFVAAERSRHDAGLTPTRETATSDGHDFDVPEWSAHHAASSDASGHASDYVGDGSSEASSHDGSSYDGSSYASDGGGSGGGSYDGGGSGGDGGGSSY